ncbi:predicted protein [Chaetoceros tenuissimus]|uniref:MYND-type domain-containing protein n=1 Tax=Chaetoceros tenuissimus TaxID=426638 RepID=A0AAD3H888_9STRA|nr:predicted protein [Chaetoceros tenuissimus]
MGKKGKKSRRPQKVDTDNVIIDNVKSRLGGLLTLSDQCVKKHLYSDAATNVRAAIQFLKTKWKVLQNVKNGPVRRADIKTGPVLLIYRWVSHLYIYQMWLEHRRSNFEAVIEVYNDLKDNFPFRESKIGKDWLKTDDIYMEEIQLYYELALVTTKDINNDTSCICRYLLRKMSTVSVDATENYENGVRLLEMTGNLFRVAKRFDEVIDLGEKLLLLPNLQESLEVKVSLAVSYIERYREEYHLRSKRDDFLLVKNLLDHIRDEYEYHENNMNTTYELNSELALAQWHYLCHKLKDEKHKQHSYEQSIRHIEKIVENEWIFMDKCSTCTQAPTKDEVKYVCSGCRVACYCSIDHQRMHWRKNQIPGTCVGHETFCPVLKAYRKWKTAAKENTTDEDKQGRMRRRFERECLHFLGYGLRLENKCFEPNDVCKE